MLVRARYTLYVTAPEDAVQVSVAWGLAWFAGVPVAVRLAGAAGGGSGWGVAETSADGALSLGMLGTVLVLAFTAVTV